MNTLPPGFPPGQTMRYPRFLTEPEPGSLERWQLLQASDAKIIAHTVARHILASAPLDAGAASFAESFEILSGRVYALVESVSRSVPGARRRLVAEAMLSSDRQAIFCATVARRCRQELGDRAGVLRVLRYVQQRTEETYQESVAFVTKVLVESSAVDLDELCNDHLRHMAIRLRGVFERAPELRDELLALSLDHETRRLITTTVDDALVGAARGCDTQTGTVG